MTHYIEPADLAEADANAADYPTVAEQQYGREPDAYEVRCTDGNYEWRRPYHGELEVIMRTGRDRSGKPFEYRALFADAPASRGATPVEVGGLVERLRKLRYDNDPQLFQHETVTLDEAATALEAQAAELAAERAALRLAADRADRAEAALAEARKALRGLLDCPDIADNDYKDEETHAAERAAHRALTGGQEDG